MHHQIQAEIIVTIDGFRCVPYTITLPPLRIDQTISEYVDLAIQREKAARLRAEEELLEVRRELLSERKQQKRKSLFVRLLSKS